MFTIHYNTYTVYHYINSNVATSYASGLKLISVKQPPVIPFSLDQALSLSVML